MTVTGSVPTAYLGADSGVVRLPVGALPLPSEPGEGRNGHGHGHGAVTVNGRVQNSAPLPLCAINPHSTSMLSNPIRSSHLDRESSNPPRLTQPPASSYQRAVRKPAKFVVPETLQLVRLCGAPIAIATAATLPTLLLPYLRAFTSKQGSTVPGTRRDASRMTLSTVLRSVRHLTSPCNSCTMASVPYCHYLRPTSPAELWPHTNWQPLTRFDR